MTAIRSASVARERLLRIPITGSCCCARAASGHVAAAPPTRAMNSRRLMVHSNRGLHPTTSSDERIVHHSKVGRPTSGLGQIRSFGDVGSMSGLPPKADFPILELLPPPALG